MIGFTDTTYVQKINVSIACWSLVCGATVSLLVTKIRRRVMYLACTISLLLCYISWTISMERAQTAAQAGTPNNAANIATLFFIYAYSPCYNMGYNALTYTYMVEVWPYAERSSGIAFFQLFGRLAGFFTTFVNPIGLNSVGWRYLISYCCWLAYEVVFVYFFFPETFGRTLEELAFCKSKVHPQTMGIIWTGLTTRQCLRTSILPTRPTPLSKRFSTRRTRTQFPSVGRRVAPKSGRMLLEMVTALRPV